MKLSLSVLAIILSASAVSACSDPMTARPVSGASITPAVKVDTSTSSSNDLEKGAGQTEDTEVTPISETVAGSGPSTTPDVPDPVLTQTADVCNLPFAPGNSIVKIKVNGAERQFRLFIPKAYDGKTYLPLVLNLHGSGDDVNTFAKSSGMETVAEREGFIVAGIAGVKKVWNTPPSSTGPDEVQNAKDTIDYLIKTVCVNSKRVFATGFSGGGRTSSLLGCKMSEKLTAIAPVAGVRWPAPCPGRALPVFAIHGLKDPNNTYKGDGNLVWNESVEAAVLGWATHNACNLKRIDGAAKDTLSVFEYKECSGGAAVKLLRMANEGHSYPHGTPINTAEEIWAFFKQFSSP